MIKRNGESGQAMVEFALVAPVLIIVFALIVDFGWIMFQRNKLTNLAGQTARYAAIQYSDSDNWTGGKYGTSSVDQADASNTLFVEDITNFADNNFDGDRNVTLSVSQNQKSSAPALAACVYDASQPYKCKIQTGTAGDYIVVTLKAKVPTLTGILSIFTGQKVTLYASASSPLQF